MKIPFVVDKTGRKNLEIYTNTYNLLRQSNNVGILVLHFVR